MSTYLQGITPYIPQIQTYQPNYNMFERALQMKQSRYDANKQKLSNLYGSLLNSPMMRDKNIKERDQFFKMIDQDIKKLSGMDLSLEQNAYAGAQLFGQLTDNKLIAKDMAWTRNWQNQMSRGQSLKNCINPEECGGMWWEGGDQIMQYKAQEFKNSTDEDSLNFRNASYVAAQDITKMGLDLYKDSGGFNMKLDTVKDGYIYTTKNGENAIKPISTLLMGSIGNNPKVQEYFAGQAYLKRKNFVANGVASGQYSNEMEAELDYFDKIGVDTDKYFSKAKSDLDRVDSSLKNTEEYYAKQIEKGDVFKDSLIFKGYSDVQQARQSVSQAAQAVDQSNDLIKGTMRTGLSKATLNSLDKAVGMSLLGTDLTQLATTLAFKDYEVSMKADEFALAKYKQKLKDESDAAKLAAQEPYVVPSTGGAVDGTENVRAAADMLQEDVSTAQNGVSLNTNLVMKQMMEMAKNADDNNDEESKKITKDAVVQTMDVMMDLLTNTENIKDPSVVGGLSEMVLSSEDRDRLNTVQQKAVTVAKGYDRWSDAQKYEWMTKNGGKNFNNMSKVLSSTGYAKLGNQLMSVIKGDNTSNAVFQIMSQNTSTRQALAGIEMGMKAQQSYANGMSKMREQVIQGIKETTDLDDPMTVSQYFEAAIDEDGTVKSFEDFQASYDQILRSQNITGDEYADKMVDAARAYYGTKGRSEAFWDQIGVNYKSLFDVSKSPFDVNLTMYTAPFEGQPVGEMLEELKGDVTSPFTNFHKATLENMSVLIGNKVIEETGFENTIADNWQQAIGAHAKNNSGLLEGLGSTYSDAVRFEDVNGANKATAGWQGVQAFNMDVQTIGDENIIYQAGGFTVDQDGLDDKAVYALGLGRTETSGLKAIWSEMMTSLVTDNSDKKENRLIADVTYQQTALSSTEYIAMNIRPNELWAKKHLGTEKAPGTTKAQWDQILAEGMTVYLPKKQANNALTSSMETDPLTKAFKTTGNINVYNNDGAKANLRRNSDGSLSVYGNEWVYDPNSESKRSLENFEYQYPGVQDNVFEVMQKVNEYYTQSATDLKNRVRTNG